MQQPAPTNLYRLCRDLVTPQSESWWARLEDAADAPPESVQPLLPEDKPTRPPKEIL